MAQRSPGCKSRIVTFLGKSFTAPAMLYRSLALLFLLATSLVVSATVHAAEIPGRALIECSGVTHADGDGDQSGPDTDRAVAHQHSGCHGHGSMGLSQSAGSVWVNVGVPAQFSPRSSPHARWLIGPGLRPPIA